jgi:serine protease Do
MFLKKTGFACAAALAMEAFGFAQSAPPPPPAAPPAGPAVPAAPRAPRVLRGYSVNTPSMTRKGYLGVGVTEVSDERARALKLPGNSGVEVSQVDENSPAAKAGLKKADVILELNGQKVEDVEQFVRTVGDAGPNAKVDMVIWRGSAKQNLTATLASRRFAAMAMPGNGWDTPLVSPRALEEAFPALVGEAPKVGFEGEMLTPQLAEFFGVKEGVLVRTVNANSAASKAGLKAGDVVTKVNGTTVTSPREISALLRAARKNATFTVMRNHKEVTLNVEVAEDRNPGPDRLVL